MPANSLSKQHELIILDSFDEGTLLENCPPKSPGGSPVGIASRRFIVAKSVEECRLYPTRRADCVISLRG